MTDVNYYESSSYIHRDLVLSLTKDLTYIGNIKHITVGIVLPNGQNEILSTSENEVKHYYEQKVNDNNPYFQNLLFTNQENIICTSSNHTVSFDEYTKSIIQKFGTYRTMCIQKSCYDCTVVILIMHGVLIQDGESFYLSSRNKIIDFVTNFLNKTIHIYAEKLPSFLTTRFYQSECYRKQIMQSTSDKDNIEILTDKQLEYLYLTSLGKKTEDLALIFNVSKYTVQNIKKRIIEKLQAENISHAIYLGLKHRLI